MATAVQIPAQITLEQYLQTTYRPDCEYIDGEVRERNVGMWPHSRTQAILVGLLGRNEREWACIGGISPRLRVSPTRVRVPDLVLLPISSPPQVLIDPPLLIIETLSPKDTYADTQERAADYRKMGVQNIWIIDPETRSARMILGNTWQAATRLEVPNTSIFVDLSELFARLDETA